MSGCAMRSSTVSGVTLPPYYKVMTADGGDGGDGAEGGEGGRGETSPHASISKDSFTSTTVPTLREHGLAKVPWSKM